MAKKDILREELRALFASQFFTIDDDGEMHKVSNIYRNKEGEVIQRKFKECNYQLNIRGGTMELIVYDNPIKVPEHVMIDEELVTGFVEEVETALSTRSFRTNKHGVAIPIDEKRANATTLMRSIKRSVKRTKENFYNYALSNEWEYFCTFTFEIEEIRLSSKLLSLEWNKFIKSLRKNNPDVKAIAVYESFKKGGYHMHAMLANCDLTLKPARGTDGKFIYTTFGNQRFNCLDWKNGFNDVVCINPNSHALQITNYMAKYMQKESPAPYGGKRYFRTQNLNNSFNYIGNKSEDELAEIVHEYGLTLNPYKDNKDVKYYIISTEDETIETNKGQD